MKFNRWMFLTIGIAWTVLPVFVPIHNDVLSTAGFVFIGLFLSSEKA